MPWRRWCRRWERRPARILPGIDFAGKTGSAQTISNELKKQDGQPAKRASSRTTAGSSASRRGAIRRSWWRAVRRRRARSTLPLAPLRKVIKAYVEKQRTRPDAGGQSSGTAAGNQAGGSCRGVARGRRQESRQDAGRTFHGSSRWQDQAGELRRPELSERTSRFLPADLEATESHAEMAHPETEPPAETQTDASGDNA